MAKKEEMKKKKEMGYKIWIKKSKESEEYSNLGASFRMKRWQKKPLWFCFFVSIGQILGGIQNEKMENNEEKRLKRKKEK